MPFIRAVRQLPSGEHFSRVTIRAVRNFRPAMRTLPEFSPRIKKFASHGRRGVLIASGRVALSARVADDVANRENGDAIFSREARSRIQRHNDKARRTRGCLRVQGRRVFPMPSSNFRLFLPGNLQRPVTPKRLPGVTRARVIR